MSSSTEASSEDASRERLPFDRANADVAWTRRVAIGVTVIGAALLAGLARTWWSYAIAVVSLVAVRFWAKRVATASHEQTVLADRALELDDDGLSLPRASGETTRLAWRDLARVEIDHDRLVVVLRKKDETEIEIEPSFGGLGLEALAARIEARRRR